MRMLALCLAIAALAACDQGETSTGPVEQAAAAKPEPQPTSLASAGTYSVTEIDGTKMTSVFAVDHTYSNTVHGNKTEAGSWSIVGGRTCLTPSEGEGAVARCYTDSERGLDGTFTATPDRGDPITVKKIA